MNLFKKKWTTESLRDSLRYFLPPEYEVVFDDDGVGVKTAGAMIAYIELTEDRREAVVAFAVTCWPGFAAELAVLLSGLLNTYVDVNVGFVASEMDDIREAN